MIRSYFAEIKGVVGWEYSGQLAFKVRDLNPVPELKL
jgi:hypothetical protein